MKKKRIIIISIIFIIVSIVVIPFMYSMFIKPTKHEVHIESKNILNLPTTSTTLKLKYNVTVKDYSNNKKSIKGTYVYCGNNKEMFFMSSISKILYLYDSNFFYTISDAYTDKYGNIKFDYYKSKDVSSSMRVDTNTDSIVLTPLLGFYQPGQYIFCDERYKANIKYNKDGSIKSMESTYGEYLFSNYQYYKDIDMTIPTKIVWNISEYIKDGKKYKKVINKTENINLISAKPASDSDIRLFNMQKPPIDIYVFDTRNSNSSTGYNHTTKMGTVDEESKKDLLEKNKQDRQNIRKSILLNTLRIISFIFIIILIYSAVTRIKKSKRNGM